MQMITHEYDVADLDSAILALKKLDQEAAGLLGTIRERGKDLIRTRFRQGRIISTICEDTEYGDGIVTRLNQATGMTETMLRECRRFYEHERFGRAIGNLEIWISDTEEKGGNPNWSHVRSIIRKELPGGDPIKTEHEIRSLERKAEKLDLEAQDLQERFPGNDEAEGVATKARQVAGDFKQQAETVRVAMRKPERIQNPAYLAFVRSHPCCISGMTQGVEAHHLDTGGMATKGSDYFAIPLHHDLHQQYHSHGRLTFARSYPDVNLWEVAARLMHEYVFEGGV